MNGVNECKSMCLLGRQFVFVCVCVWLTYQRCRVKLRDHVMEEGGQVCGPRLEQLYTLETTTLTIDLRDREIER